MSCGVLLKREGRSLSIRLTRMAAKAIPPKSFNMTDRLILSISNASGFAMPPRATFRSAASGDNTAPSLLASEYRIASNASLHYNHHTYNRLKVWIDAEGNH